MAELSVTVSLADLMAGRFWFATLKVEEVKTGAVFAETHISSFDAVTLTEACRAQYQHWRRTLPDGYGGTMSWEVVDLEEKPCVSALLSSKPC